MFLGSQLDKSVGALADRIKISEEAGMDYGVMAPNTPHVVVGRWVESVDGPLTSIVDETCQVTNDKKMQ